MNREIQLEILSFLFAFYSYTDIISPISSYCSIRHYAINNKKTIKWSMSTHDRHVDCEIIKWLISNRK